MLNFPRLRIEEFEPYLDASPITEDIDGYSRLASFSFETFTEGKPVLQNGGVAHGFQVITSLIKAGANLYYEARPEDEISVNGIRNILLASKNISSKFAELPHTINSVVEKEFGLKEGIEPVEPRDFYVFNTTESGTLKFGVNPLQFSRALEKGWRAQHGGDTDKECSHKRIIAEYFWPQMVTLAADSPRLIFNTIYPSEEKDI